MGARLRCARKIGPIKDAVVDFPSGMARYFLGSLNTGRPSGPVPKGGGCIIRVDPFQAWRGGVRPAERLVRANIAPGGGDRVACHLRIIGVGGVVVGF